MAKWTGAAARGASGVGEVEPLLHTHCEQTFFLARVRNHRLFRRTRLDALDRLGRAGEVW